MQRSSPHATAPDTDIFEQTSQVSATSILAKTAKCLKRSHKRSQACNQPTTHVHESAKGNLLETLGVGRLLDELSNLGPGNYLRQQQPVQSACQERPAPSPPLSVARTLWRHTVQKGTYLVECLDGANRISVARVEACTIECHGHAARPGHAQRLHSDACMRSLVGCAEACKSARECQRRGKGCCRRHCNSKSHTQDGARHWQLLGVRCQLCYAVYMSAHIDVLLSSNVLLKKDQLTRISILTESHLSYLYFISLFTT